MRRGAGGGGGGGGGGGEPVAPVNQMHATDHVITASTVALLMQAVCVRVVKGCSPVSNPPTTTPPLGVLAVC